MSPYNINTPTPIGCLAGFFGLIATALAALCFRGAYKAFSLDPPETEIGRKLLLWGVLAALPAALGILYALYRIVTAGRRDHYNIGTTLRT